LVLHGAACAPACSSDDPVTVLLGVAHSPQDFLGHIRDHVVTMFEDFS